MLYQRPLGQNTHSFIHSFIEETVQGFHLDLVGTLHQLSILLTDPRSKESVALIYLEIQQMLEKGAIHVVPGESYTKGLRVQFIYSPKKGMASQRPVVNLQFLNQFIPHEHFKVEGIHMLKQRQLYGQDRPEGRLSYSANLEKPRNVSEVCLEGNDVPVCLFALLACKCSQSLHQTNET